MMETKCSPEILSHDQLDKLHGGPGTASYRKKQFATIPQGPVTLDPQAPSREIRRES